MKAKNIFTAVLLLFVAASMVALAVNRFRRRAEEDLPSDGVIVYYFHGERCPTCRNMETYTRELVEGRYSEHLRDGRLHWRVVDYTEPQNVHFKKDYEFITPVVVLVEMKDGDQQRWESLPKCMDWAGDKADFVNYVQKGIETFLSASRK